MMVHMTCLAGALELKTYRFQLWLNLLWNDNQYPPIHWSQFSSFSKFPITASSEIHHKFLWVDAAHGHTKGSQRRAQTHSVSADWMQDLSLKEVPGHMRRLTHHWLTLVDLFILFSICFVNFDPKNFLTCIFQANHSVDRNAHEK